MTEIPNVKQDYLKEKVRKFMLVRKNIELMKKRHEDELKPLDDLLDGLEKQIKGFLQQLGVRFLKTEYGDPGLFTKTSIHIEDQDAFKNYVITNEAWDLIVWAARRTAVEAYLELHKAKPPGVHIEKFQELRVTAPTPLGKKRVKKAEEVAGEKEEFNAFK